MKKVTFTQNKTEINFRSVTASISLVAKSAKYDKFPSKHIFGHFKADFG